MEKVYLKRNMNFVYIKERISIYSILVFAVFLLATSLSCVGSSEPIGLPAGVIVGENLYIGTMDKDIRSLRLDTGELVWVHSFDNDEDRNIAFYGDPVINRDCKDCTSGSIYFTSYNGSLYIVKLENISGQISPKLDSSIRIGTGEPIVGGSALIEENLIVPSSDGQLYSYNLEQFTKLWEFSTSNKIWTTPVLKDTIVYFGSLDQNLYALDTVDGSLIWDEPFKTDAAIVSKPLILDQTVYIGSFDGIFYGIDVETGLEKARFSEAGGWYWGGAITDGETIFVGSLNGNIYALNKIDLTLKWNIDVQSSIVGSPVILNEKLVFSSTDGRLRTVNLSDGQNMRQCKLDIKLKSNLVSNGEMVFISGEDHSIRGIIVNANGNLNEEWVHYTNKEDPVPREFDRSC